MSNITFCPACGHNKNLTYESLSRRSIAICKECYNKEREFNGNITWWVDSNAKLSNSTKFYLCKKNRMVTEYELCQDEGLKNSLLEEINNLDDFRVRKTVIYKHEKENFDAVVDFQDFNTAKAWLIGRLVKESKELAEGKWMYTMDFT